MEILNYLAILTGIALFLFGMNIMGEGLTKTAGGRLELLLEKLSSTPFRGMLLGTIVTAVIQSSAATIVMVVGFVNSGILKLTQAAGIILGANLGTTITAWILSLAGLNGVGSWLSIFKPSSFVPILAFIGIILYMFIKDEQKKNIGKVFLGFSVLMVGMQTMSDTFAPLADTPEFSALLLRFSNPLLGFAVGMILTAILQSSSASIGILQAVSMTGTVTLGTAIPIVLGQNLGSCITTMLSSIGANTNGKRAAYMHLTYKLITEVVFMTVFYALNFFIGFKFMANITSPFGIAAFHTFFNFISLIFFFPFTKYLVEIVVHLAKEDEEDADIRQEYTENTMLLSRLDDRFLNSPTLAVAQCMEAANGMAILTKKTYFNAAELIKGYSDKNFNKVIVREEAGDVFEDRIGTYIVKLSSRVSDANDSNKLSIVLHCISNLERITDHAKNLAFVSQKMKEQGLVFTENCNRELDIYISAVNEIVNNTIDVFINRDVEKAKRIEPLEEVIDGINARARRHHVIRMRNAECSIEAGVEFDNIVNDLERISDHCSNIAVCIIQINENVYETHEYLDTLRETQTPEFQEMYKEYYERYKL